MADVTPWIEHLNNPLVLVGFALFTLAGLVKLFKPEKLTGKATEGLFHKGLNFAFVLGLLVVIGGFANSFMQMETAKAEQPAAPPPVIKQTIDGSNGVQGQAGRDLGINQGNGTFSHQVGQSPTPTTPPANVEQELKNSTGVQGQGGRDTYIQTPGK
jgi:hypothetical protein